MNQQTEERPGIIEDKLYLIKYFRKILFVRMLCNPVFILAYWYFCRTLYKFCMYGGVKKRGTILALCMVFFLVYLVCYFIRCRKVKVGTELPETINKVKWYGFSKDSFYLYDKNIGFFVKKCDKEEKDYIRLRYSVLPKYKHFFWKIPAYIILLVITIMTICGVIKSGTKMNGKLAWYLYIWSYEPVVTQEKQEDIIKEEDSTIVVVEIIEEDNEQKETIDVLEEIVEEIKPVENPEEKMYGTTQVVERCYKDDNDEIIFAYEIYEYIFSDSKYQKVNETLQGIYEKTEAEYQKAAENEGGVSYVEAVPEWSGDFVERVWSLADLTYVQEDYVSLIFKGVTYAPVAVNFTPIFSAVTIDISTGEIADVEDVTGYTWQQLGTDSIGYIFCLYGDQVHLIKSIGNFGESTAVPRVDIKKQYQVIEDEVYNKLIFELIETNTFPATDGVQCDGLPYENFFSVVDIDDDGKEELLIDYENTQSMAGMAVYIYDYDRETKEIYIEYMGFPSFSVFDNGYIKEEASHNHGRSNLDDFWPYELLKYNKATDKYECVANIDAWQYQIHKDLPPDPDFPIEEDLDGDGIVYYHASMDDYEPTDIMDKSEYDTWCAQYNGGNIKEITWIPIIFEEKYNEMFSR